MVKAELVHNPYLLTTTVTFNGQSPKINSPIEKYEGQPLKNWVRMVPRIFYEEMNGYDFELYFTGTVSDFTEIRSAFQSAGVTDEQVRLIYRNEIEDPLIKGAEIDTLLEWLRQNPNRKFNYEEFWEQNEELFEGLYPLIVIGGSAPEKMDMFISPESVTSAQELVNTNLASTPIIFIIEESNRGKIRADLQLLLKREDIHQKQLFFMISPALEVAQVTRVISDLGVKKPQIIKRMDDEAVLLYVKNYPVTEYVRSVIRVVSGTAEQIGKVLDRENQESAKTNAEVYHEIELLDAEIDRLKKADEKIVQRDNYEESQAFATACQDLTNKLRKWKDRKTIIRGEREAEKAANEFSNYINKTWYNFLETITSMRAGAAQAIDQRFAEIYAKAEVDPGYYPERISLASVIPYDVPYLIQDLLESREVSYGDAMQDLFGIFRKASEGADKPVPIITFYLEKWRSKAIEKIEPAMKETINSYSGSLKDYYDALAAAYHKHLVELITDRTSSKEKAFAKLSDDERRLQEDVDWLANVNEKLQMIERA